MSLPLTFGITITLVTIFSIENQRALKIEHGVDSSEESELNMSACDSLDDSLYSQK